MKINYKMNIKHSRMQKRENQLRLNRSENSENIEKYLVK